MRYIGKIWLNTRLAGYPETGFYEIVGAKLGVSSGVSPMDQMRHALARLGIVPS
jgi:hypothetical protein